MIILAYAFVVMITISCIYAVCRAIDHYFQKKEMTEDCIHKQHLLNAAGAEIRWLTDDMLKKVNDAALGMYKSFTGDNEAES